MDAPPAPSPFATLLPELLERIAWHAVASSPGLAPDLVPLLSVCRHFHACLSSATNPHLYARIFAARFDTDAPARRLGDHWLSASGQTFELRKRFTTLRRIRANDVRSPHLTDDLWTAYLMMSENDGKNEALLCERASAANWVRRAIAYKATLPSNDPASWFHDLEGTALALWLLWRCEDDETIRNEDPADRTLFKMLLHPFLTAGFRYSSFHAADTHFRLPLCEHIPHTAPSACGPSPPSRTMPYFGRPLTLSAPPLTAAATLAWMRRTEVAFAMRAPGGAAAAGAGLHTSLPVDRQAALAAGWRGPTQANMWAYESKTRVAHPRRGPVPRRLAQADENDEDSDDDEPSRREDEDWGRLVACVNPWAPAPVLRGKVYTPGAMAGCFRGSFLSPELFTYAQLLRAPFPAAQNGAGDPSGGIAGNVRLHIQPLYVRLHEHHCLHPTLPALSGRGADGLSDDLMSAWLPRGAGITHVQNGVEVTDPTSGRVSRYETFRPGRPEGEQYSREAVQKLQVQWVQHMPMGDHADDIEGGASTGAEEMDAEDESVEESDEGSDEEADAPPDIVGKEDEYLAEDSEYEDVVESLSTGVGDILLTGETDGEHAAAWGQFRFVGRVRSWDGLVVLLRYQATPIPQPDLDTGRWIFRGYLHGDNFVGRWRETATAPPVVGYEGSFVLSRSAEAW